MSDLPFPRSWPLDKQIAARAAFREGITKANPQLLEPIMRVEVITPEESMGDVIGDLNTRRGQVGEMTDKPGGMKQVGSSLDNCVSLLGFQFFLKQMENPNRVSRLLCV